MVNSESLYEFRKLGPITVDSKQSFKATIAKPLEEDGEYLECTYNIIDVVDVDNTILAFLDTKWSDKKTYSFSIAFLVYDKGTKNFYLYDSMYQTRLIFSKETITEYQKEATKDLITKSIYGLLLNEQCYFYTLDNNSELIKGDPVKITNTKIISDTKTANYSVSEKDLLVIEASTFGDALPNGTYYFWHETPIKDNSQDILRGININSKTDSNIEYIIGYSDLEGSKIVL